MAKPRSARGVLREARKLLETVGWGKGSERIYANYGDGSLIGFCAIGALHEVDTVFERQARERLAHVIRKTNPNLAHRSDQSTIVLFNDSVSTIKADVIEMFEKAEKVRNV